MNKKCLVDRVADPKNILLFSNQDAVPDVESTPEKCESGSGFSAQNQIR
jgi:hypothetical protein